MPRGVSRLIAVVALLAFLAANSPALSNAPPLLGCSCGDGDAWHCGAEEAAPAPDGRANPTDTASPCHGHDHPGFPCPCPGGCAYCCVAKTPCAPTAVAPAVVTPRVDGGVDEAAPVYNPPFSGTPTRPPRP
jgi:hypothetical protein